jgi:Icc-related predicted phosphoesterase
MKFSCISDTHGIPDKLKIESSDFIIHSGDILKKYKLEQVEEFVHWYSNLPAKYKILVAGNHDRFMTREKQTFLDMIKDKIIYLENSGIELEGIKFWGSPSVKWCGPYKHFTFMDETEAQEIFSQIPPDTDILISHGPPYGILDSDSELDGTYHHGSKALLERILQIKPRYHVFGHVHRNYGQFQNEHTIFINSCIVSNDEIPENNPFVFEFNGRQ